MATPAYRVIDRRSAYGYSNNQLIKSATQTDQRPSIPFVDYDITRNISEVGRRLLMNTGRMIYENIGVAKGAIQEQARHSVGSFIPQYDGENEEWGNLAEEWLRENDKWIDLRGWPFSFDHFKRQLVISNARDGELGVLLTEDAQGNGKIQVIPSHRIGSRTNEFVVIYPKKNVQPDGTVIGDNGRIVGNIAWEGRTIIDGVIVDEFGTPIAYRLTGDVPGDYGIFRDVSANDFIHSFLPDYPEQLRGFSWLAVAAFDLLDVNESSKNEMIAQLINSTFALQIKNETGTIDEAKQLLSSASTAPNSTTGAATDLPKELLKPGQILYVKSGTDQGVEAIDNSRPSVNVMNFQGETLRRALAGLSWSSDFSLDPSKVGGAQMRIVIEKINARIAEIQKLLVAPICRRIDSWRIAKAIKNGRLPFDKDWFRWEYQAPEELTADEKYSSDVALQEFRGGPGTLKKWSGRKGGYWKDDIKQKIRERKFLQEECAKEGVDPDKVLLMTPNGNVAAQEKPESASESKEKA